DADDLLRRGAGDRAGGGVHRAGGGHDEPVRAHPGRSHHGRVHAADSAPDRQSPVSSLGAGAVSLDGDPLRPGGLRPARPRGRAHGGGADWTYAGGEDRPALAGGGAAPVTMGRTAHRIALALGVVFLVLFIVLARQFSREHGWDLGSGGDDLMLAMLAALGCIFAGAFALLRPSAQNP